MCSDEGLSGARFRQILLVGAAVEREPSLKYFTIQFYVHPGRSKLSSFLAPIAPGLSPNSCLRKLFRR